MKSMTILAARYDEENDRIEVVKEIIEDDDSVNLNLHTIDPETLEWKAAELGTEDLDEIIDLVLHEPFIEDVKCLHLSAADALSTTRARVAELKSKMRAPTKKASAKSVLQSRGVHQIYIDAADDDPIQIIKGHSHVDEQTLNMKRAHIEKTRQGIKQNKEHRGQVPERVARLRSTLQPKAAKQARPQKVVARSGVLPPIALTKKKDHTEG